MEVTYIGVAAGAIGLILLVFARSALFGFVAFCSIFGAASAVNLTAMGSASIPPGYFALAFLAMAVVTLPGSGGRFRKAIALSSPFLLYAGWAVLGAFILPRLFQGQVDLPPMKMVGDTGLYFSAPLAPSGRNITQAVYILGTAAAVVMTVVAAMSGRGADRSMVRAVLVCGLIHVSLGVLQLALESVGQSSAMEVLRNGNYAQLDQTTGEFHRIAGAFSETSAYSGYGFFYFVFAAELWVRGVQPRLSALTALALSVILVFTTSTSAYIGLAAFALCAVLRMVSTPNLLAKRLPAIALFASGLVFGALLLILLTPAFVDSLIGAIMTQTVEKVGSFSGLQRTYWARKGMEAFTASHGLGVGVGSFRSSSLVTAILGSAGVFGAITFLLFAFKVLRPIDRSTWDVSKGDDRSQAGAAAGWAAVLGLAPSLFGAAGADPGLIFGLFAGLALAWRPISVAPAMRRAGAAWRLRHETYAKA